MDKAEVREKRKYFLSHSEKTTLIGKGDKRIGSATRFCAVCGKPLSSLIYSSGKAIAVAPHLSCRMNDSVRVNICYKIESCYHRAGRREEQNGNV